MPEPDDVRRSPAVRRARRRTVAGWVAVGLLAVLGLVAVGLGVAARTVWLPDDEVSASARTAGGGTEPQLVVTAPGVLETRPGPVTATATSPDGGPVVLVLGRETDVTAWTDGVPTAVVGGLEAEASLAVEPPAAAAGDVPVPDPAASDLWAQVAEGEGSATLELDPPEGRWLLLAASDGTAAAPEEIVLTWPQEVSAPASVPLLAGGGAALLGALVLALVHRRTSRRRHQRALAGAGGPVAPAHDPEHEQAPVPEHQQEHDHEHGGGRRGASPWAPDRSSDEETR
ncbi:hypothetical protein [uncultured Pseudokineococcus sp.]|uniref:hypothetical protein n=1 Tax=uncultured Pseudokineococcus sp. TaxID=1642928 RepID=UPI002615F267|nr:hypothetical protein [uncultured Pseudokineococcus sp.]